MTTSLIKTVDAKPDPRMSSVLQDWVMALPLRQQGVLVLALRGPDGARKESETKPIVRSLRACVMISGREGHPMAEGQKFNDDSFMRMDLISERELWFYSCQKFFSCMNELNLHFFQHLTHAALICSQHPNIIVGENWHYFYRCSVRKLHFNPETIEQMTLRLRNGKRLKSDE